MFFIRSPQKGNTNFRFLTDIPTIITQNLLTSADGLIPRRNVDCNFLGVYKIYSNEVNEKLSLENHINNQTLQLQAKIQGLSKKIANTEISIKKLIANEKNSLIKQVQSDYKTSEEKIAHLEEALESYIISQRNNRTTFQLNPLKTQVNKLEKQVNDLDRLNHCVVQLQQDSQSLVKRIDKIEQLINSDNSLNRLEEKVNSLSELTSSLSQKYIEINENEHFQSLEKQLNKRIYDIDKAIPYLVKTEIENLSRQVKLLRMAILFSSSIGFLSLLLAIIALL